MAKRTAKGAGDSTRALALKIAKAAKDKKALKTVVLDMRELSTFCDYFVIASGNSLRQVHAIAEGIRDTMDKEGVKPLAAADQSDESGWLVLDYRFVVAHVFYKPLRDFYALENLWSDAKKVRITGK
jgi:ribosome-associated protein